MEWDTNNAKIDSEKEREKILGGILLKYVKYYHKSQDKKWMNPTLKGAEGSSLKLLRIRFWQNIFSELFWKGRSNIMCETVSQILHIHSNSTKSVRIWASRFVKTLLWSPAAGKKQPAGGKNPGITNTNVQLNSLQTHPPA